MFGEANSVGEKKVRIKKQQTHNRLRRKRYDTGNKKELSNIKNSIIKDM